MISTSLKVNAQAILNVLEYNTPTSGRNLPIPEDISNVDMGFTKVLLGINTKILPLDSLERLTVMVSIYIRLKTGRNFQILTESYCLPSSTNY